MNLDIQRVKYWLGVGAQPTETVSRILQKVRHTGITSWTSTNMKAGILPPEDRSTVPSKRLHKAVSSSASPILSTPESKNTSSNASSATPASSQSTQPTTSTQSTTTDNITR